MTDQRVKEALLKQGQEFKAKEEERERQFKLILERLREGGKNNRANQAEGGRNKRFVQRYGDDGAEAPKSELDMQIDSVAKKNAEKAAKRKTSAPPIN